METIHFCFLSHSLCSNGIMAALRNECSRGLEEREKNKMWWKATTEDIHKMTFCNLQETYALLSFAENELTSTSSLCIQRALWLHLPSFQPVLKWRTCFSFHRLDLLPCFNYLNSRTSHSSFLCFTPIISYVHCLLGKPQINSYNSTFCLPTSHMLTSHLFYFKGA